jgi:hypothetical protein
MKKLSLLTLIVLILASAMPTLAHEDRTMEDFSFAVGWRVEPAFSGQMNGPDVYIAIANPPAEGARSALEALDVDLQIEVSFGPESITLPLEPNLPFYSESEGGGHINFVADLVPTLPGDYTFRVTGTIEGLAVDETFTSADGMFSTVEPLSDIQFPRAGAIDLAALLERIETLEARLAEIESAGS